MTLVSVTRLRIRSLRFMPPFLIDTNRAMRQTRRAEGFLSGSLLADRKLTFWTMTLWRREGDMRQFMADGAHRKAMPKLLGWCDEASVVHWLQDDPVAPGWPEADRRMRAEGRPSRLRDPGPAHHDLSFAAPKLSTGITLMPRSPA